MKAESIYLKKIIVLLKVVLVPITFGFIFYKLYYSYHITSLWSSVQLHWDFTHLFLASGVFLLMILNWWIESAKWHLLVSKNEQITLKDSAKAVLSGIALNIITPNQLGDFIGRVIHLKQLDKIRGTLITVIGHTAQVIMTAAFGLLAAVWFLLSQNQITISQADWLYVIICIAIFAALILYLNIKWVYKLPLPIKLKKYLDVFLIYTRSELVQVLLFSFLRYSIFVLQYILLLYFFGVNIDAVNAIACIIIVMCVQSFVPSFVLVDIGMRGASALWFFSYFTNATASILLSAYSLWIVNLMLPGLLGLYFILRIKQISNK